MFYAFGIFISVITTKKEVLNFHLKPEHLMKPNN